MKPKCDLLQNVESLILFRRICVFFLLKKAIIYRDILSEGVWKERKALVQNQFNRIKSAVRNQNLLIFANYSESKLSRMQRSFAILVLQLRRHEGQSSW